jgi:hypothetical protein
MRFTTGKWNDDGIPSYSWLIVFDDLADKTKYIQELQECVEAYRVILKNDTWNMITIRKENGELRGAMRDLVKLFREMIIIKNLFNATIQPGIEFDYVFIAERDQGVGQFLRAGSPCPEYITAAADLTEAVHGVIRKWTNQKCKSGSPGNQVQPSTN